MSENVTQIGCFSRAGAEQTENPSADQSDGLGEQKNLRYRFHRRKNRRFSEIKNKMNAFYSLFKHICVEITAMKPFFV